MDKTTEELYHVGELDWNEGEFDVHRGFHWSAPGCHDSCGMLFYLKDGKLDHVEGDPAFPYNQGRLCERCLNMAEIAYSPDRLKYPMKRSREDRGKDAWERITWEEALDIIEENVNRVREEFGPESIVAMEGTGRNVSWQVPYLCYCGFKSPNFSTSFLAGDSCAIPRMTLACTMFGAYMLPDCSQFNEDRYENPEYRYPATVLIWGCNSVVSSADGFWGHWIIDCMRDGGTKLVVVDTQVTWLAAKAEVHIQPRPGTDCAVAMAMGNVIIDEGLCDDEFIDCWCAGFEEYREAVSEWTPEKAAEIAWCDAEDIRRAARFIAMNGPLAIHTGVTLDMSVNGMHAAQAAFALVAITGNVDKPGTNIIQLDPWGLELMYTAGWDEGVLSEEAKELRLDDDNALRKMGFAGCASADQVLTTMETGSPYPLKMCWIEAANPITCMGADAPRVYKAMLESLDFIVVCDYVMTPTASGLADLVLPIAMSWERNSIRTDFLSVRAMRKFSTYYEAKTDEEILVMVGRRVNPEFFSRFETDIDIIEHQVELASKPVMTYENLRKVHYDWPGQQYRRYEKGFLRGDGQVGFATVTGRVELKPTFIERCDMPALPYYQEPLESPFSTPELYETYPFVLTTGGRTWQFFHSEGRNQPSLRAQYPDPRVKIHPDAADDLGIDDGDWVWIENVRGRCRQRACVTDVIDRRVVIADHAWWYPEKPAEVPSLSGNFDSNINNLTQQGVIGPHGFGAPYRNLLCKIYPCTEQNSEVSPGEQVTMRGGFSQ